MASNKKLKKELSFLNLYAISTGTMISSGFFLLPSIAFKETGPSVVLAFLVSGLLVFPALFSKAELATAMPKAGGTYYFLDRSMGPLAGTIGGIGVWLSLVLKSGFALIGFSYYFLPLANPFLERMGFSLHPLLAAITMGLLLGIVNLKGVQKTGSFQLFLVVFVLSLLGFFIGEGLPHVQHSRFHPFFSKGMESFISTIGMVFISYAGVTKIASVAEEAQDPDRSIPYAMLASLITVMIFYGLGVYIVVGVMDPHELALSKHPISDASLLLPGGQYLYYIISIAAIMAFISCANAGILSASRYPFAMARDHIFPSYFTKISKNGVPYISLFITLGSILLFISFFAVKDVAKLASAFQLILFIFANLALIVMRESEIPGYHPGFISPLYPWMQILGIFGTLLVLTQMGMVEVIFSLGMITAGIVWYYLYVSHQIVRDGAVKWVFERMARRRDPQDTLVQELMEIQREKGNPVVDPFEEMVIRAPVLNIEEARSWEDFFETLKPFFQNQLDLEGEKLKDIFLALHKLENIPFENGVAIPHLRLDTLKDFHLFIGRSKTGIPLPNEENQISYAIFVVLGPKDHSGTFLRILASLALRAEKKDFLDKWKKAGQISELKQLLVPHLKIEEEWVYLDE
ncbi:MAG: amino acid permease [Planctomycetota bacterium]|nr:MAG: amino acid permease [Planctomycetota bacterium]